jgi:hypothetical protein
MGRATNRRARAPGAPRPNRSPSGRASPRRTSARPCPSPNCHRRAVTVTGNRRNGGDEGAWAWRVDPSDGPGRPAPVGMHPEARGTRPPRGPPRGRDRAPKRRERAKTTRGPDHNDRALSGEIRRRPTLPGRIHPSTIGAGRLNFRVRNGNGCDPVAIATEICCRRRSSSGERAAGTRGVSPRELHSEHERARDPSPRPISTGQLNTLPCVHFRPINVVVSHGPYPVNPVAGLIFERASHLDAFSGYPFRRSLTSCALGRTTGTRELRPSRSSRTRDSLRQSSSECRG